MTTKYNIGVWVYVILSNYKIARGIIKEIKITNDRIEYKVLYNEKGYDNEVFVCESLTFDSMKECEQHIMDNLDDFFEYLL